MPIVLKSGSLNLPEPSGPVLAWTGIKNVKVKCSLVQALRLCTGRAAHRGSRSIALLFLDHGIRRGKGSASRPGRSLPSGKTRYTLYRRLGGPQGRSGQVRKISPPPGFDHRTVQPVASRYIKYATLVHVQGLLYLNQMSSGRNPAFSEKKCWDRDGQYLL